MMMMTMITNIVNSDNNIDS